MRVCVYENEIERNLPHGAGFKECKPRLHKKYKDAHGDVEQCIDIIF